MFARKFARGAPLLLLVATTPAPAQSGTPPPPQAQDGGASTPPARVLARTLVGDVAVELRSTMPGGLSIGAAGASSVVTIDVRATDARRWADSAAKLLLPVRARRARGAPLVTRSRALLEEPGAGGGALDFSRTDSAGQRRYVLFVGDAALEAVRQEVTPQEARTLVRTIRRAAVAALPRRPPPPRSPRPAGAKELP